MKEHCRGEAGDSSRRNRDIEEQETGVELVSKLPQIVSIANYAQGAASAKGELYSTAFNLPRGTTFLSTPSPGFHQHGPPISAYKFKPSRRG